jgi:hypothetical protein
MLPGRPRQAGELWNITAGASVASAELPALAMMDRVVERVSLLNIFWLLDVM